MHVECWSGLRSLLLASLLYAKQHFRSSSKVVWNSFSVDFTVEKQQKKDKCLFPFLNRSLLGIGKTYNRIHSIFS